MFPLSPTTSAPALRDPRVVRAARSSRAARPLSTRGGFTLIELLMVVALMAVMIVVGIKFNPMLAPENNLDAAARDVSTGLEQARNEAIVGGRPVRFEVDLGTSADAPQYYRSIRDPEPGKEKDAEDDELLLTVREWKGLPAGVRIESVILGETEPYTSDVVRIAIQPDGTMPSCLVRLWAPEMDPNRDRAAGWACVQVAGLLGQARVLNRYVDPEFLREDGFQ